MLKNQQDMILVTGASGFIGSALIWALNQQGITNILACDTLESSDKYKNLISLRFKDYCEADQFQDKIRRGETSLDQITHVFHLGACSTTTETNNRYLIENNYQYTQKLAHWSLAKGVRFVYASSAATYGDGSQGMDDEDDKIERLRPLNMYGYSKHLFDLYAKNKGWLDKIVGLKYFNVYGPNEGHKGTMRSLVNKAFYQIRETQKVQLFKSYNPEYRHGEQKRDFLYVKDAVAMTLHLAENNSANGLFNIGSAKAHTWIELVNALFSAMGLEPKIEFIDMPENLRSKYQYYTCAKIEKLNKTGYNKIQYSLENSIKDYVKNYLLQERYLEPNTFSH